MAQLKVGIVGAGDIADLHALGYEDDPRATIAAVCDTREDRAISRALDWGAESYYTNLTSMLERERLDAVEILTPNHLHAEQAIRVMEYGADVCVERPIALSIEDADRILQTVEKTGRVFQTYEPCLFHKPLLDARNLIDSGEIGNPLNMRIVATVGSSNGEVWDFEGAATDNWRFDEDAAGGSPLLFDVGYQSLCIGLFLIGTVERVSVWNSRTQVGIDNQLDAPAGAMWKHFQQECYGSMALNYAPSRQIATEHQPLEFEVTVNGSRGDVTALRSPDPTRFESPVQLHRKGRTVHYGQKTDPFEESFKRATRNFIGACLGESDPLLRANEGKQLLVLTLAYRESSRRERSVSLQHG